MIYEVLASTTYHRVSDRPVTPSGVHDQDVITSLIGLRYCGCLMRAQKLTPRGIVG